MTPRHLGALLLMPGIAVAAILDARLNSTPDSTGGLSQKRLDRLKSQAKSYREWEAKAGRTYCPNPIPGEY